MNSCNLTSSDVKKWVQDLFQDPEMDIPEFAISNEGMELMSAVILLNKEAEKDAKEIIKTELNLVECILKKDNDIHNSIAHEVSIKDLSVDVAENIRKVASLSVQMKLKDPSVTNFLLSSAALENKKQELIEKDMLDAFTLSKLSRKITDIMQKNATLERKIEALEKIVYKQQNVNSEVKSQCEFIRIKGDEYQKRILKTEKKLRNLGWNSSLSHNELVKRAEVIQCLEQKVNNIALKLESYENLPPNEMLTQLKIEEAQGKLLQLENEFDELLKTLC